MTVMVLLCLGAAFGANENLLLHPQMTSAFAEMQGRVQWINLRAREMDVTDTQKKTYRIKIGPETRIKNNRNEDLMLGDLSLNDAVRIWYSTVDLSAQEIDRLPTLAETLMAD